MINKKIILCIMDGWGISNQNQNNAIGKPSIDKTFFFKPLETFASFTEARKSKTKGQQGDRKGHLARQRHAKRGDWGNMRAAGAPKVLTQLPEEVRNRRNSLSCIDPAWSQPHVAQYCLKKRMTKFRAPQNVITYDDSQSPTWRISDFPWFQKCTLWR